MKQIIPNNCKDVGIRVNTEMDDIPMYRQQTGTRMLRIWRRTWEMLKVESGLTGRSMAYLVDLVSRYLIEHPEVRREIDPAYEYVRKRKRKQRVSVEIDRRTDLERIFKVEE